MPSELPIVQAPMAGGPSTPALTAAVADAGGYGFVAAGYLSAERLREGSTTPTTCRKSCQPTCHPAIGWRSMLTCPPVGSAGLCVGEGPLP